MTDTKYILELTKVREVKTPEKAAGSAGWDFYIPTNLNITDFTKNAAIYSNLNLVRKTEAKSPAFFLKNTKDGKELCVKFYIGTDGAIKYLNCNSGKTIIPEWNAWIESPDTIVKSIDLEFGEKVLIPSGIRVKLPENVFLNAENKSGIASKRGLVKGASLIDPSYMGEIHINLINACNNIAILNAGDKIIQFVPYFQPNMNEIKEYNTPEELYKDYTSERGTGGFGSTDANNVSISTINEPSVQTNAETEVSTETLKANTKNVKAKKK